MMMHIDTPALRLRRCKPRAGRKQRRTAERRQPCHKFAPCRDPRVSNPVERFIHAWFSPSFGIIRAPMMHRQGKAAQGLGIVAFVSNQIALSL
jgi:hypothetical protein